MVLQCRQITFKGEGANTLKRTFIIIIIIIVIFIIAVAADVDEISKTFWGCAKKVFTSGTSVSIFQNRSGCYLLYGRIETYKSHDNVYNSFLDAQIKGAEHSF